MAEWFERWPLTARRLGSRGLEFMAGAEMEHILLSIKIISLVILDKYKGGNIAEKMHNPR